MSDRWGVPVQELKSKTTSSEFSNWMWYIRWEARRKAEVVERQEYYLAQIALEVFNAFRSKRKGSIKDFIINFTVSKEPATGKRKTSATSTWEGRMDRSKAAWLGGILGGFNRKARNPKAKQPKMRNKDERPSPRKPRRVGQG